MAKTSVLLTSLAAAGFALAGVGTAVGQGDAARGDTLAHTCLGCHGIEGYKNAYPTYRVPMLGGQSEAYLVIALQGYKDETRAHDTMHAQAATMSQQDIEDVAAYFAAFGEALASADAPPTGEAPQVAAQCVACHSENGISISPQFPNLAGQHESYLANSLYQYKSGARQNQIMGGFAAGLSEEDIEMLSAFYADQSGLFTTED